MLFIGALNLRSNYLQYGGNDTNHIDKQMTKDTIGTSQLGHSSQYIKSDLTKSQKSCSRGRTGYEPKYQLFFLLVFLQDKLSK